MIAPCKTLKILVVDDQALVRDGIVSIINRQPDLSVVGDCADGYTAINMYGELSPDVVVLDLKTPEFSGRDVIKTLRCKFKNPQVLVLTTFTGDADVYHTIQAGARGYLLKDTSRVALFDAIRTIASGKKSIHSKVAEKIAEYMERPKLTARELEILKLVAEGYANKEIAVRLKITEGTVKTHINSLLTKLGATGRTAAVTIALRRGLIHLQQLSIRQEVARSF